MSNLIPYRDDDPLREMERMMETMRDFVRLGPAGNWYTQPSFTQLPVNVREEDNNLIVEASLPGISEDDVSINITGDVLTISAERQQESKKEGESWHIREFQYGRAARSIRLPQEVNAEHAEAELKDGILSIRIPVERPSRHKIEIKAKKAIEGKAE